MNNDFRQYSELYHHGVKGMRWGVRRYQNPDGSLTPEGKRRYFNPDGSLTREGQKHLNKRFGVSRLKTGLKVGASLGAGYIGGTAAIGRLSSVGKRKEIIDKYIQDWTRDILREAKTNPKKYWGFKNGLPNVVQAEKIARSENQRVIKNLENRILRDKKMAKIGLAAAGVGAAAAAFALYKHHKNKKRLEQNGRQYIELMRTGKMQSNKSDSAVTKRVKNDYNNLTDQQFKNKYGASKSTYMKRVNKYGDPYMNSPLAKMGKALSKKYDTGLKKQISALERKRKAYKT